jgi:hypothetical protein
MADTKINIFTGREMEKAVIMFGGGYDVTFFNQVRAYIDAK